MEVERGGALLAGQKTETLESEISDANTHMASTWTYLTAFVPMYYAFVAFL